MTVESNCVIALVLRLLRFRIGPHEFVSMLSQSGTKPKPKPNTSHASDGVYSHCWIGE